MNHIMAVNQILFYCSSVGEKEMHEDFFVDFFLPADGDESNGTPVKSVHNFDELIEFMEQMEEN